MKPVTSSNTESTLTRANSALRNKDFGSAIELYEVAISQSEEPLKAHIRFNLELAKKQFQNSNDIEIELPIIESERSLQSKPAADEDWRTVMHAIKSHFDPDFYQAKYPDIVQAGVDPLEHFCVTGWLERRDPRSDFSVATYLELNSDVAVAGVNPFWHYVVAGKAEGRKTQHPGGYRAEILKTITSLKQMAHQWQKSAKPPELMTAHQLAYLITNHISSDINRLAVSVSHDHYKNVAGGIQLCIQREEQLSNGRGILYLNVHPWQPLPILASEIADSDPVVHLVLNGKDIGVCSSSVLTQVIKQARDAFDGFVHVIVHSLLGHSIERVKDWVFESKDRHCWFWLHDFFSLCPSYALQRNNISFCNAPSIDSNACAICVYGDERRSHLQRMNAFFESVSVTTIAPSEVAKQFWLTKTKSLATEIKVSPHMEIPWMYREKPIDKKMSKPITVGYLGAPVYHKGWNVFEKLAYTWKNNSRFRFVYCGKSKPPLSGLQHINVHVDIDDFFAMVRAVSEAEIDYVLHWSTCLETFSFTTHEAIAGGAYVLTNQNPGNVAATVSTTGKGMVFPDEKALFAFFEEGTVEQMTAEIRSTNAAQICRPLFSEMSLPFLMQEGVQ